MTIDKNDLGSPSADNNIFVTWQEGENGPFEVSMRFAKRLPEAGSPTVTVLEGDINGDFTAKFSGGSSALLGDVDGKPNEHLHLVCPNLDEVVITVERQQ